MEMLLHKGIAAGLFNSPRDAARDPLFACGGKRVVIFFQSPLCYAKRLRKENDSFPLFAQQRGVTSA